MEPRMLHDEINAARSTETHYREGKRRSPCSGTIDTQP